MLAGGRAPTAVCAAVHPTTVSALVHGTQTLGVRPDFLPTQTVAHGFGAAETFAAGAAAEGG